MHWYFTSLLFLSASRLAATVTCYSQGGTAQDQQLCNSPNNTNACCNIEGGDICSTSGLCLATSGFWYQDGCTSEEWDNCPSVCPDRRDGAWELLGCDGTIHTWCCREPGSTSNCCANETATTSANFGTLMLSTVTRTVSGTSEATVTATSCCVPSGNDTECSHTSTVTVGAGVGASLGALLLASTATLIWRERTRPKAIDPLVQSTLYDDNEGNRPRQHQDPLVAIEMDSTRPVYEVEGRPKIT